MTASTIKPAQNSINDHQFTGGQDVSGAVLMLASSNLPIGSYTYSQGVETAIEVGLISDEQTALAWLEDYLKLALLGFELPLLLAHFFLLQRGHHQLADTLAEHYMASRESHEFSLESSQLAHALSAWVDAVLQMSVPSTIRQQGFLPLFVHTCQHSGLSIQATAMTYAFGQLENMVLATVKTVPLGQMAGQRVLWQLQVRLESAIHPLITQVEDKLNDWLNRLDSCPASNKPLSELNAQCNELLSEICPSANLPNLAILSCQHERQYSRLFRS
ncbi:urease accessory protein UreF [Psychrobacter sp. I-STPA6b]|uniref:urease accessory protein UreF n=1 Tax=Psychrobacter sp. I-STPA6b TaxID=2585718 RepID=UPI001D0C0D67|nr:urease accessory UreF family protein [Psychrobacter sp. I-STPA6b]